MLRKKSKEKMRAEWAKYKDGINARRREKRRKVNVPEAKWRHQMALSLKTKGCVNPPLDAPPDVCNLCGRPPKTASLAMDHDHHTGMFRGWLCVRCNTALGTLGDNEVGVQRALLYVQGSWHDGKRTKAGSK